MKIYYSTGKPPNNLYNRAKEKFGCLWDDGVIFTYGDTVYSKNPISEDLKIHEATHVRQQELMGKDIWWERYFDDKEFRLSQEVDAYTNQWQYIKENCNRSDRKMLYKHIINSMVNGYGGMITRSQAEKLIC